MILKIIGFIVIISMLIEGVFSIQDAFRDYNERKHKNDGRTNADNNSTINGDFREDTEL